ncbi:MAG: glycerophosphodiester phosphodiesterase family protein [Bryobacterales bacterium]|nr:glycerophosphodiester phosphodiesterase family protein [Bryobacterales bacterium]
MNRRRFLAGLAGLVAPAAEKPSVKVIAHRGDHSRHPENTLPAFQAAIDAGCDYVEMDVRASADGELFLRHGAGRVAQTAAAELRAAGLARFWDALDLCRGRCRVYVDWKQAPAATVYAALRDTRMTRECVVYGGVAQLREIQAIDPLIRVMPEAVSAANLRRVLAELKPSVIAFDAGDFKDELIAMAKQAGADVFVDRLGAADNEAAWRDAVGRGATGIQTDRPAELIAFLHR